MPGVPHLAGGYREWVLKLRDSRTGELADALPAGRRLLSVLVHVPGAEGLRQARAYLAADLIRRLAEQAGFFPWVIDLLPAGADMATLRARCDALNVYPTRDTVTDAAALAGLVMPGAATPAPDGPVFDVGVASAPPRELADLARLWIQVSNDGQEVEVGEEPLVVRIMLMRHRYGEPIAGDGTVDEAARALARWRVLVAEWARSPSGAMSRRYADAVAAALADDLDSAAALTALDALADDPDVPDGVKFETFAAADRLLGLDLARDVGK